MLDPKQTPLYTPTADDTPPTITITPSLTIDAHSVTGSIVQSVWDNHKTSVNTGTAPRDLGVHFENDGGDEKMQGLDARDRHEQPISSVAAGPTSPALDRAYVSAAIPVTPATAPADDLEDHKVPTSPAFEVRTTEDPPVAGEVTTSTSEPGSIKAPSSAEEKDKPLRQGYDVTTGTFYYFHEATPPPKPEQVEDVHEDVTMNEDEDEDGEEEKSRGSASEPERSSSPPSSALPGLMRTRRRPRISYAEPYSMRDSESRSPSPTGQPRTRRISIPKRVYGKRGSRQLPGPDGCPPPPSLRGGMTPKDCYLPLIPTNIQPVEGIKQMTMEQKTQLALQLGGRPLRKKELVYVMERMDPDLKNNTDRGWLVRNFAQIFRV